MVKDTEFTKLPQSECDYYGNVESLVYPTYYQSPVAEAISNALFKKYKSDDSFGNTYEVTDTQEEVLNYLEEYTGFDKDAINNCTITFTWDAKTFIEVIQGATV